MIDNFNWHRLNSPDGPNLDHLLRYLREFICFNLYTLFTAFRLRHPTWQQYVEPIIRQMRGHPLHTETDRGGGHIPYAQAMPCRPKPPTPLLSSRRRCLILSARLPPSPHDDVCNWVQGDLGNWEGRDGIWQAPMAPMITLIRVVNGIPSGM